MLGYKELKDFQLEKRKLIIIEYSICIVIVFIICIALIVSIFINNNARNKETHIEKSNVDYKVYLKDNEYFSEKYLGKDNQYIANLIDHIEVDFNYELNSTEKNIEREYEYKIVANINVKEKNTRNMIYNFKEEILAEKKGVFNTNNALILKEIVNLDYNKYNDLINKFVGTFNLDNQISSVTLDMYVKMIDDENANESDRAVMSLDIPLTTKTIAIDINSNEVNGIRKMEDKPTIFGQQEIYILIILLVAEVILGVKLNTFIHDTQSEFNIYKMKLRKILNNYGSFIQKIEKDFDFEGYQAIEMKTFESLLQIRDILGQPILMLERTDESFFMVPTQSKLVYIFELNMGDTKKRISDSSEIVNEELV